MSRPRVTGPTVPAARWARRPLASYGLESRHGQTSSVSSREGLILDLQDGRLIPPACNGKCMVTFHYYEPRAFTTQQRRNASEAVLKWSDSAAALALMAEHFESVVNATPPGVSIYLGDATSIPACASNATIHASMPPLSVLSLIHI